MKEGRFFTLNSLLFTFMIELKRDKKSPMWIVTRTDSEGFHSQLTLTREELLELYCTILKTDL